MTAAVRLTASALAVALILPGTALAEHFTHVKVVGNATPAVKLIILGLIVATLAALVVCTLKLLSGARMSGGSAFLSGLRLGGPLAGLLGAAYGGLNMSIGLANVRTPPVSVLAHGAAEILLLIMLGLLSGAVAVLCHWAVEARIDRTVLGA